MKKIVYLIAVLVISILFAQVTLADDTVYESGFFSYTLDDSGNAKITKYNGNETNITLPFEIDGHKVTKIGSDSFRDNPGIEYVAFSENIEVIGTHAFDACTGLKEILLPSSVKKVYDFAFDGCRNMTKAILPDGLTELGRNSFTGCSSLTEINIPGTVEVIGDNVFENCSSLEAITLPEGLTMLSSQLFSGCTALKAIVVPSTVETMDTNPFAKCSSLTSLTVAEGNKHFEAIDNVIFCTDDNSLVSYPAGKPDTSYAIPEGTTAIREFAFFCAENLMDVSIPSSVAYIGQKAFAGCTGIRSLYIPATVTEISTAYPFKNDPSLLTLYVDGGSYAEQYMIDNGFAYCIR